MTRSRPAANEPIASPGRVPDLLVEQLVLGELPPDLADDVRRRLEASAEPHRLDALRRSDDEIRAAVPPTALARRVIESAAQVPRRPHPRLVVAGATVGLVTALAVFGRVPRSPTGDGDGQGTAVTSPSAADVRVKGDDATLEIFRRTERGSERLQDGARANPGDTLRIGYRVAQAGYGAIVSVDGAGHVTRHLPAVGGTAVRLTPGDLVLLDQAFELDDAPRFEQFHLVTSATPFEVARVVDAIADAAGGRWPPALTHTVVSVSKESHP